MPWTVKLSLESATDGGDSVGTITGTFTDEDLFVDPFTCSIRDLVKGTPDTVLKLFPQQLDIERNKRAVQAKLAVSIQDALNKQ